MFEILPFWLGISLAVAGVIPMIKIIIQSSATKIESAAALVGLLVSLYSIVNAINAIPVS